MTSSDLPAADRRVDEQLAQLADTFRFLLDLSPVDAAEWGERWVHGDHTPPEFTYRPLSTDPDVVLASLERIDVSQVDNATVATLLRGKKREMQLQAEMLRARNTPDFLPLSIECYGSVTPVLRDLAKQVLQRVEPGDGPDGVVSAQDFLALARAEIDWYRGVDPDVAMHAEVREDVHDVLVSGDTLLIGADTTVPQGRTNALLQHEIGTHLVTQVNGSVQPLRCLGVGLAGYDETQEGLAVLAEVACGQLTRSRLRQLAGRVLTVDAMVHGTGFDDCWQQLVSRGFPRDVAFTVVMRVHRSGGFTKDACYLRGLVDLLAHLRQGGGLDTLYLGKFGLRDLPLLEQLVADGLLAPARLQPHYLADPAARERLHQAATTPLVELVA